MDLTLGLVTDWEELWSFIRRPLMACSRRISEIGLPQEAGIDDHKVEGRGPNHVALVTKTLRTAVDSYYQNPSALS